nr:RNA-directed DNA polymerase, eukaryota [Tanacetum cinerariifolium]
MGDKDWTQVKRKVRNLEFNYMNGKGPGGDERNESSRGRYRTKVDDVARISTSVYVTNFPESFSAKDLFHSCKQYGHVVDSFIPTKRSKAGKRFGFVRFINVFSVERLVSNLCSIWNDRLKIQVNIARYQRSSVNVSIPVPKTGADKNITKDGGNGTFDHKEAGNSYIYVLKRQSQPCNENDMSGPMMVLDEDCLVSKELSNVLFGRVKEFASAFRDNVSIGSWFTQVKQATMDFTTEERIAWVEDDERDEEEYKDGESKNEDNGIGGNVSDEEEVPDTVFETMGDNIGNEVKGGVKSQVVASEDPFNIYSLLNDKKEKEIKNAKSDDSMEYPSGFTPADHNEDNAENLCKVEHNSLQKKREEAESFSSGHFKKSEMPRSGGSILNVLEEMVKVGQLLWEYLTLEIGKWKGEAVVMGDFNEVRCKSDIFGSMFYSHGADVFNSFIDRAGLVEVPLGGSRFTWCHKSATKMSKLDRFLVSENLFTVSPNINAITLERYLSDHRPILLCENQFDYGPIPFRFFHHWWELDGFYIARFKDNLAAVDSIIDSGNGNEEIVERRMGIINDLQNVDKIKSIEMAQKAKIKWAIEGDENSRFFHGTINKKRSLLNIRGVLVDGRWIEKPVDVKMEFYNHFSERFAKPGNKRDTIQMLFPRKLSLKQQKELENEVSNEEIKKAVWNCGTDKAPGPDGYTFGFYRKFWYLIEGDVCDVVKFFFTHGNIPKGCNSSFIALIPKIPDFKLVKDYRPISLVGSLYKIIAKIMANRLVDVLGSLVHEVQSAFIADRQILDGPMIVNEWCYWIQSCLKSSRRSIIINGSPTDEFQFFRGLKQGDPLSPFLFILIMESLHLSFEKVVEAGLFNCIQLSSSVQISHMFYADDAVFLGQWCDRNISTLSCVLECFHRVSGLRINMCKSKIMGINVEKDRIIDAARKLGCLILTHPFSYLGSIMGNPCLDLTLGRR